MQKAPTRTVIDVITDFLATEPSPQEVIDFYMPEDLQARLDHLLDKNGEGELTYAENAELQAYLQADRVVSLLKVKMKLKLKQQAE